MYQSYQDFLKATEESHATMVTSGEKMSVDAYRETVAKLFGYETVEAFKEVLDSNYQPSYVLVYMWQGVTETVRAYKDNESGKAQMLEDFIDKVKDRLNVLPDGSLSSEEQCILDEAVDALFYEDSKITVTCYKV